MAAAAMGVDMVVVVITGEAEAITAAVADIAEEAGMPAAGTVARAEEVTGAAAWQEEVRGVPDRGVLRAGLDRVPIAA